MKKFFRCDSCKKLLPEDQMEEIMFKYSTFQGASKHGLVTETVHGMICQECGEEKKPTSTKTRSYKR